MSPSKPVRILYLEDDKGLARLLQRRMRREGHEVDLAHDGLNGLALLEKQPYDVLLVDYRMPGISGLEVLRRLAAGGKLPPAVMLTGAGDEATAVEAMKLGAGDYIVKDAEGGYLELMPVVVEKVLNQQRLVSAKELAERELRQSHENMEKLVYERTEELLQANSALKLEISERRRTEALLREARQDLERQVKERTAALEAKTANLEELNVALKVLLKQREDDRRDLEDNLMHNVKNLILPHLEHLKSGELSARQKIYIEILESNLHRLTSPLARRLSSSYFSLTPTEIRVASLIKQERTTKEIADAFHVSESAIIYHRHNIRKKLGLNNKKINLKTYLQSLGE
jgi:DNA-binding response OmpR family regulator/DNA-binding CsgD family transcriptional regulator